MSDWETLGAVDPCELTDARLQLHWAAQAAAGVGKLLLPHQADYGEQSFQWLAGHRVLAQGAVEGRFRSAVRPSPAALVLLDGDGAALAELPLEGRTVDEAYAWIKAEVERLAGRPLEKPLERPGKDFPAHPVGNGAVFSTAGPGFAELGRYYADADRVLRAVAERNPGASPVRCWPHHFDIATLILLDISDQAGEDAETARSIGVGFSPGDGGIPEPYLYVLPGRRRRPMPCRSSRVAAGRPRVGWEPCSKPRISRARDRTAPRHGGWRRSWTRPWRVAAGCSTEGWGNERSAVV